MVHLTNHSEIMALAQLFPICLYCKLLSSLPMCWLLACWVWWDPGLTWSRFSTHTWQEWPQKHRAHGGLVMRLRKPDKADKVSQLFLLHLYHSWCPKRHPTLDFIPKGLWNILVSVIGGHPIEHRLLYPLFPHFKGLPFQHSLQLYIRTTERQRENWFSPKPPRGLSCINHQ
jgi:hypothetical protein